MKGCVSMKGRNRNNRSYKWRLKYMDKCRYVDRVMAVCNDMIRVNEVSCSETETRNRKSSYLCMFNSISLLFKTH